MNDASERDPSEHAPTGGCQKPETYDVDLGRLRAATAEYGPVAFLLSVTSEGRPHCAAVTATWSGDTLVANCGARTAANIRAQPAVALVWPPRRWGEHSLIVDGSASLDADKLLWVEVQPTRIVRYPTPEPTNGTTPLECEPV